MDPSILQDQTGFRQQVIEALPREPVDYVEQFAFIHRQRETKESFAGGGVLLPLFFQGEKESGGKRTGEYVFLLNKRSKKVLQPGDLCAPGGGIHPFLDSITQKLLSSTPNPDEAPEGSDFLANLNPDSLVVKAGCRVEPSLGSAKRGDVFQFERVGYFIVDPDSGTNSSSGGLVFNRSVSLRDTWGKIERKARGA